MQQYGTMTKLQAVESIREHTINMRRAWIARCIDYMKFWEEVRTPARWQNMSQYHRNMVIQGWIFKRIIMQEGRSI